jgi:hypothetical protein
MTRAIVAKHFCVEEKLWTSNEKFLITSLCFFAVLLTHFRLMPEQCLVLNVTTPFQILPYLRLAAIFSSYEASSFNSVVSLVSRQLIMTRLMSSGKINKTRVDINKLRTKHYVLLSLMSPSIIFDFPGFCPLDCCWVALWCFKTIIKFSRVLYTDARQTHLGA